MTDDHLAAAPSSLAWYNLRDIVARSLLIVLMVFIAEAAIHRLVLLGRPDDAPRIFRYFSEIGALLFAVLVCFLAVIRLPARGGAAGWAPVGAALGGAFILTLVNRMPVAPLPPAISLVSGLLLAAGNIGSVYCLAYLGRSFSVLPEARKLVASGPYALVRHPLYLAEAVAMAGTVLLHWSLFALLIGLVQSAFQYYRLRCEEAVLVRTFPDYAAYAAVTPRLLPRLRRWVPSSD
ncbi:MAG TPA: isoprenylcysteine carboxylmethyltransferase family protein [Magnetospirillaceae bacterium]|nr:isoprenylcysteine carboxylmethyltransferase family protein [Magnetospirillaceae bacterium]